MLPTISHARGPRLVVAAIALATSAASAQEPTAEQARVAARFGMDDATFRRLFGTATARRRAPTAPSATVEELADQVGELRIFTTGDGTTVTGEVAIAGPTRLREITLPLEQGAVTFNDAGRAPDQVANDRVFTATFRMNVDSAWRTMRPALAASAQAIRTPNARVFVRRGPRDIVPVPDAIEALRRTMPATLRTMTASAARAEQLAAAGTAQEALRVAGVGAARTPFLLIPGPAFDPQSRFRLRRVFDIPIFDIFPFPAPPVPIDEARALMITHPTVVDGSPSFDPCTGTGTKGGAWSFGHLMREMSFGTGMSPEDFVMHWLSTWVIAQEANGFIVNEPGRAAQLQARVIQGWQNLSGPTLDVDRFPARLLAIVNRPDLADRIGYGVAGSAGEGRFVFGLLEKPTAGAACNGLPFTVIFEYGIKGGSCSAVKAWHQRWKNLEAHALGSAAYNTALELITRDFTDHGSNPGLTPNQSSLNQLRTNENALDPLWQLREFRLQSSGAVPPGLLDLVTVKQTPDDGFRNGNVGTPEITAFIAANEAEILGDRHVVPERFPGIFNPFMGAKSDVRFPPNGVWWNAPGLAAVTPAPTDPVEARRKFSLGTCNACHGGETRTFFTHIGNTGMRNPGTAATLSGFLTGITVPDPAGGTASHMYADLAERESKMSDILTQSCFALLGMRRIPFVH
jgi:hypothetical protein